MINFSFKVYKAEKIKIIYAQAKSQKCKTFQLLLNRQSCKKWKQLGSKLDVITHKHKNTNTAHEKVLERPNMWYIVENRIVQ